MIEILGIDIGGVIIDRANDKTDTSFFSDNYLKTTAVEGAFEAIALQVERKFGANVFLVSKAGPNTQRKTLQWLQHHDFWNITKVPDGNIRFCLKRREKAAICAELGITHFIDDRLEILSCLETVPNKILFNGTPTEMEKFKDCLDGVIQARSWKEVLELIS